MPLVGLVDDSGKCVGWDDIMAGKGDFSDPHPLLLAIMPDRVKTCDFSVTELLDDPFFVQMKSRYEYYQSVDKMMDLLLGTAWHSLMEKHGVHAKGTCEKTFKKEVTIDGRKWVVTGTCDYIEDGNHVMWDYKTITMSKLKMIVKPGSDALGGYDDQLNFYYYLSGYDVELLRVRLVVRDWRFYEFRKEGYNFDKYPRGGVVELVPSSIESIEKHFMERLKMHAYASGLTDDELHKAGKCDTWGGLRCEHYCPVNDVCPFYTKCKVGVGETL